jgi:hypothetical protein
MGMDTMKKKKSRRKEWMNEVTEVIYVCNVAEEGIWSHRS